MTYSDKASKLTPYLAEYFERAKALTSAIPTGHNGLKVEDCVTYLASVCDGAIKKDRQGYSITDAPDGHRIASRINYGYAISRSDRDRSHQFVQTYRETQLEGPFTVEAIQDLIRSPRFTTREDTGGIHIPHVSMHDQSGQVWVEMPQVPSQHAGIIFSEYVTLAREANLSIRNQQTLEFRKEGEKIKLSSSANRIRLLVGDRGVDKFVTSLNALGFTVDNRVTSALSSEHDGLLFAGIEKVSFSDGGKRDMLYCFIQERKPNVNLKAAADALVQSFGLKWATRNSSTRTVSFPLGVIMLPALREFCTQNKIGLFTNAEHTLAKPEYHKLQRTNLRSPDHPYDLVGARSDGGLRVRR